MSNYELREGQVTLFKNKNKQEGDNKPDLQGNGLYEGKKIKIAAWLKTSKNGGTKYYSLKIQPDNYNGGNQQAQVGGMEGTPVDNDPNLGIL